MASQFIGPIKDFATGGGSDEVAMPETYPEAEFAAPAGAKVSSATPQPEQKASWLEEASAVDLPPNEMAQVLIILLIFLLLFILGFDFVF